tara:strand:- start:5646 stop:7184 length:1539 start_codon:yes stop_codon:yes gene_type:complete
MNSHKSSLCTHRWGYSVIDFGKNQARTCCRTKLNKEDINQLSELKGDYFLNTKYQLERRLEMLHGIRDKSCETCWLLEDQNFQSPRRYGLPRPWKVKDDKVINIKTNEEIAIKDITIDHPVLRSAKPYMIEVNLSNHCDMSCLYCSPHFSSTWASANTDLWAKSINPNWNFGPDEAKKLKLEVNDQNLEDFNSEFWAWFKNVFDVNKSEWTGDNHLRLGILGGEPINNPRLPQFIDNLCEIIESIPFDQRPHSGYWDHENKKPHHPGKPLIWFVTNGNTRKNHLDKFIDRLPRLCKLFTVEISLSIESYKERAEYIRMNLDWDRFDSNVREYLSLDLPLQVGFQTSINNLCLSSMPDFLRWVVELYDTYNKPIFLKPNVVNDPDHYRVEMLPASFMKYIIESIDILKTRDPQGISDPNGNWHSYSKFLATLRCDQKGEWSQYEKMRDFLEELDKRRNLDVRDVFPEMWEFWNIIQGITEEMWEEIQQAQAEGFAVEESLPIHGKQLGIPKLL